MPVNEWSLSVSELLVAILSLGVGCASLWVAWKTFLAASSIQEAVGKSLNKAEQEVRLQPLLDEMSEVYKELISSSKVDLTEHQQFVRHARRILILAKQADSLFKRPLKGYDWSEDMKILANFTQKPHATTNLEAVVLAAENICEAMLLERGAEPFKPAKS